MMRLWLLIFVTAFTAAASDSVVVSVAQDGSGDFKTIQMAIDHAPP